MDTTAIITLVVSSCIVALGIIIVGGAFYGILVWYPRQLASRIADRKASGRQGEATILRLPESVRPGYRSSSRAMYKSVLIGLEIRVPGIEPYEVDKTFMMPAGALSLLEMGKVVPVWVDPNNPRDLDRIVIDLK